MGKQAKDWQSTLGELSWCDGDSRLDLAFTLSEQGQRQAALEIWNELSKRQTFGRPRRFTQLTRDLDLSKHQKRLAVQCENRLARNLAYTCEGEIRAHMEQGDPEGARELFRWSAESFEMYPHSTLLYWGQTFPQDPGLLELLEAEALSLTQDSPQEQHPERWLKLAHIHLARCSKTKAHACLLQAQETDRANGGHIRSCIASAWALWLGKLDRAEQLSPILKMTQQPAHRDYPWLPQGDPAALLDRLRSLVCWVDLEDIANAEDGMGVLANTLWLEELLLTGHFRLSPLSWHPSEALLLYSEKKEPSSARALASLSTWTAQVMDQTEELVEGQALAALLECTLTLGLEDPLSDLLTWAICRAPNKRQSYSMLAQAILLAKRDRDDPRVKRSLSVIEGLESLKEEIFQDKHLHFPIWQRLCQSYLYEFL